ncbi:isoquinoline 1-oxidoreductase, alpha subunit [Sphingomonas gellani]|uniref:Isoquinoline 1-oxidoreductase, alpha subunit n=1 Tax=Sphingomonas gellani TaxID=1166340 RepID=A0A1H8F7R7_9SPHN|nr:(2Fe-2S)-binding protein [Sphingomonas gellani]SEN27536.1 isoquinoline 1-oxidoreductase, alpha subunit [Sphingomonas gellani]
MSRFTVNNQPTEYRLDPQTPLLWALRDASNLTGTKYGCGTGQCGACTVDIDGQARRACQVPIGSIEGSYVTTIEGLSRERNHPVQLAFLAENVGQCGFCIPGMVMAAAALLRRDADPSEDRIRAELTNLCRCGIYPRLVEAVQRAGRAMRGEETIPAGPRPGISPEDSARLVPALVPPKTSSRER